MMICNYLMFDKDFELEMENNFPINESNNFPKFILGDTFENEEILFVTHTEYPQFILNIETQEIKFLCKINNEEKNSQTTKYLIQNALAWADLELDKYTD